MRHRPLGRSGFAVSVVGYGCNNLRARMDDDAARAAIDACFDTGITLFDTADIYGGGGGSEELLGILLEGRRDDAVLATKFGAPMPGQDPDLLRGSRRYIRSAVEASLRRLRTDRIDLYQLHMPDPVTPVEETLAALDELVREGKILYAGSSNFAAWQVADADWTARERGTTRFISAQNHWSLLERDAERELAPACAAHGVGILPYFPLANGLLTGKYRRGEEPPTGTRLASDRFRADRPRLMSDSVFDTIDRLTAVGAERGHSLLEVAIAGLAAMPAVASVIAGATSAAQVRGNAAAGEWEPSADDVAAIRTALGEPATA